MEQAQRSLACTDHAKNKLKKRKRSRESQQGDALTLKEKSLKDNVRKDGTSPAAKKWKGHAGVELTRKQRRNRKKNSSKKNKYKHLALNKSQEANKTITDSGSVAGLKDLDRMQLASVKSVSPPLETVTYSTKAKKSLHLNSLMVSTEKPVSAVQSQSRQSAHVSSEPVTSPKRKKKGKVKHQIEKQFQKRNCRPKNKNKKQEFSDDDDDSDTCKSLGCESGSIHDHIVSSVDRSEPTGTISHTDVSSKKPKTFEKGEKKVSKKMEVSVVDKAREKLNAARFRYLNEQLYTSRGADALRMFQEDPESFQVYHQGFQHQVSQWPVNPLDVIIKQLGKMSKSTVVADFGCGDARLAESLPHNVVHSFDLVSSKPCVTACDIAKVPLEKSSVEIAVFCLSLMGTNLSDYLCEANRVLKKGGLLKVAEVVSRFHSIARFVKSVEAIGFHLQKKTFLDKMFMLFTFKKIKDSSRKQAPRIQLKACYYKRR